ncbi:hydrolase 76 protein [Arthrobotrys megalospora]
MRSVLLTSSALLALSVAPVAFGQLSIDLDNTDTVKAAAKVVLQSMVDDYTSQKPFVAGLLPSDYSFFESGLFFNTVLDYAAFTGDKSFNSLFEKDFFNQIGSDANFMPADKSARIANDDVGYWALAAIAAAEYGAKPADSSSPDYLTLAENAFNNFVERWDSKNCNGGLRWTITPGSTGYDFKDTNSNGVFFQLSARLGLKTGNQTYFEWATKVYDWTVKTGLIGGLETNNVGEVYAGASVQDKCQQIDKSAYSAQQANYIYGCIIMYAHTKSSTWLDRALGYLTYTSAYFSNGEKYIDDGTSGVVFEAACSPQKCTLDQKAGLSVLFRSLGVAVGYSDISTYFPLQFNNSAKAAAKSCSPKGECNFGWSTLKYNASAGSGYGEKMAVIESFLAIVRRENPSPVKGVFQAESQTEGPSTTDAASAPSQTTSGSGASNTPNSGSRVMAGSVLGGVALVSFLHMLL